MKFQVHIDYKSKIVDWLVVNKLMNYNNHQIYCYISDIFDCDVKHFISDKIERIFNDKYVQNSIEELLNSSFV